MWPRRPTRAIANRAALFDLLADDLIARYPIVTADDDADRTTPPARSGSYC